MPEKIYKVGGSDDRTGPERLASLINRAFQKKETEKQKAEAAKTKDDPVKFGEPSISAKKKAEIRALRNKGKKAK